MTGRVLWLLLLVLGPAQADERILNYHSDILIRTDGWIEVTETIKVRAEGQQIRRGIYRDYPIVYEDRLGNDVKVLYEPKSVLRNSDVEDFRSEARGSTIRTYFGRSDRMLNNGEHTYTYRYDAGRMLGFFDTGDELYWNVTGHEWSFPIDQASATITFDFPVPVEQINVVAFIGVFGASEGGRYDADIDGTGVVRIRTTGAMSSNEGLTIVVAWPTGFIKKPSGAQKIAWLLLDNLNLLIAIGGLIAMLGYYIPVWHHFGKDPDPGVVLTLYEPPKGFSAASLRYIENMGYDNAVMTAAIISLAVKGYVRVEVDDDTHSLHRAQPEGTAPVLASGEKELLDGLFADRQFVTLTNENHQVVGGAKSAHEKSLKRDYHKRYFRTNGLLNLPPLLIGLVSSLIALSIGPSLAVFGSIAMMVVTIVAFAIIMKRPTAPGRQILDQVAGFKEFLEIAEKDEMNLRNPPAKTPALFEKFLPFALALGVEQQWAERFTRVFASLKGPENEAWHPAWYNGSWNNVNLSTNTSGLMSGLDSAISSSVTPPGSSSGSSGGFSGGGGGGGGGGGW